ncbi:hypothetical protein CRE_05484 [Caenorhabditis remanei]|uniref:Glycosyltransferase family 92 protein n=1 Tax=Caenorhabditis remanei TaxID=31234 RepID=E3LZJ4_CAERE|nr:hypothetical protein CRE_05484 [Caenorhabditis remanei]
MGRDVSYSPFTWQNQSAAQNRFLKFLLLVILLFILSFFIGFPNTKVDVPKPESQASQEKEISYTKNRDSATENNVGAFNQDSRSHGFTNFASESSNSFSEQTSANEKENSVFDNSVVPSGPDPIDMEESYKVRLAKLEEEERRITESEENLEDSKREKKEEAEGTLRGDVEEKLTNIGKESEAVSEQTFRDHGENKERTEVSESQNTIIDVTDQENKKFVKEGSTSFTDASNSSLNNSATNILNDKHDFNTLRENTTSEETVTPSKEGNTTIITSEEAKNPEIINDFGNVTEQSNSTETVSQETPIFENLSNCNVEYWNNVTLEEVPHQSVFKQWIEKKYSESNYTDFDEGTPTVLGAFVYKNYIAVTLSARNFSSELVYCRYYDCKRKEMVHQMTSFIFPEYTVYCPRRSGAKFISISENLEDKVQYPVQIVKRLLPHHFFTVCVAMNGPEDNILRIARFIEYYKLQGSTFFHVYFKNSSHYQRMLLDDYIRTGDIKVVRVDDNQSDQDCLHRNKYFSKWTAFLNLDDLLEVKDESETISSFLDSITDHKTNILKWSSSERNDTTRLIVRPERIISINHNPISVYLGNQMNENDESSGLLKLVSSFLDSKRNPTFREFVTSLELSPENFSESVGDNVPFKDELIENVISRTKYVYTTIEVNLQKMEKARSEFPSINQNLEASLGSESNE